MGFSNNLNQIFEVNIFAGAIYNSNQMNLYVQVYDNDGAFTVFDLPNSIIVYPVENNFTATINKLISEDSNFQTNIILNEGSFLASIQEIQRISSLLNYQSLSDKLGLVLNRNAPTFPQLYGPLSNYSGVKAVNKKKYSFFSKELTNLFNFYFQEPKHDICFI